MSDAELPPGFTRVDGRVFNDQFELVEWFDGRWMKIVDASRSGWWRYHAHYDRNGYCDNPARGY